MKKSVLAAFGLLAFIGLTAESCIPQAAPAAPTKETQANKAAAASNALTFDENAEIDNIAKRIKLTAQPGLLGYVALVNRVGQVVMYSPVKGKLTSGGKRLTSPDKWFSCDGGEYSQDCKTEAPSDEGTFGQSNPYIFFWTPGDQYIQTSMDYIYSDKPFRTSEKPLLDLTPLAAAVAPAAAPAKP